MSFYFVFLEDYTGPILQFNGKVVGLSFNKDQHIEAEWYSGIDTRLGAFDNVPRDRIDIQTKDYIIIDVPFNILKQEWKKS